MASKKAIESFNKSVTKMLVEMGATIREHELYNFSLQTKAGELLLSLHRPEASKVFSLFCRFEDVPLACQALKEDARINRHSGKWNFHYFTEDELISRFTAEIEPLLIPKTA